MSKAMPLDEVVKQMQTDGGTWRKVEFYTKSSTDSLFTQIRKLDGVANVHIYEQDTPEKFLTIEVSPKIRSNT